MINGLNGQRVEKSNKAFGVPKLLMVPFLNLLLLLNNFLSIADQLNLSVFLLWGDAVQ